MRDFSAYAFARKVLLAALLLSVLIAPNIAFSALPPSCVPVSVKSSSVSGSASCFCDSAFSYTTALGNSSGGSLNGLIDITLLLLLLMLNIVAVLWLLGSAFRIDRLVRFARAELGEIVVTGIVVVIFLGGFAPLTTTTPFASTPVTSTALSQSTFYNDCYSLAQAGGQTIYDIVYLYGVQESLSFFSALHYGLSWSYWGIREVDPLLGLSQSAGTVNTVTTVAFALTGLTLGVAYVLGFFYALLPLFFFLGIVFRSFPWTRAAGGAFLGLFLGFFVVFPMLINILIGSVQVATFSAQSYNPGTVVNSGLNNPLSPTSFFPSYADLGYGAIAEFITSILGYLFYILIAIVISFVVAFDFTEAAGDFLGAPSLSSQHALRNVI